MTSDRITTTGWLLTLLALAPLGAALASATGTTQTWSDLHVWQMLADTALFATLAALIGALVGFGVGRAGSIAAVIACVPLVLPSSLLGSAWIVALGRTGPLGDWLTVYDWPVAAGAVGLRYIGLSALLFATQRRGPGPAAGVYPLRNAWWWLGVKPAIGPFCASFVLLFILSSADHVMPSMFLIHTYGTQVLIQYNALNDLPGAAALASPMLLIGATGALILWRVIRPSHETEAHTPKRGSWWLAAVALVIAVGVPLSAIVWRSGSLSAITAATRDMQPEAVHTAWLGFIGALICVSLGWPIAGSWLAQHRENQLSPAPLLLLNLVAPPSMLALGLIDLFSRWPLTLLRDTDAALIVGYVCRFLPIAVLLLFVAGLRQPQLPVIAARHYRVRLWPRLRHIQIPAWRGALAAALILCGLLIATELEASLLLTPAGVSTVGVRLYTLIHTAPDEQVSAAALSVLLMLLPLIGLGGWLIWWRRV